VPLHPLGVAEHKATSFPNPCRYYPSSIYANCVFFLSFFFRTLPLTLPQSRTGTSFTAVGDVFTVAARSSTTW
jgi:hypothetical protein